MSIRTGGQALPLPTHSIALMQQLLNLLLRLVRIEAHAVIRAPEFFDKLRLARLLTQDIDDAEALAGRIAYLGGSADLTTGRMVPCPDPAGASEHTRFRQCCAEILAIARQA